MVSRLILAVGSVAFSGLVFGQQVAQPPAIAYKDSYQLDYMDIRGTISFTNTGLYAAPSATRTPDICVNAYVFKPIATSPDGVSGVTLDSCCSCRVAPNAVGTITPVLSGPVVVKLVATLPKPLSPVCDATLIPSAVGTPGGYAAGMRAWSVSQPTVLSDQLSTSLFAKVPLSDSEQTNLAQLCAASATKCVCQ